MTLWSTGPYAVDCSTKEKIEQALEQEKPSIEKLYPGISFPTDIPTRAMNWAEEEYSQGCYSTLGAGQEEMLLPTVSVAGQTLRKVFRPVGDSLYFAGEHVVPDNQGTMEAAAESGLKNAEIIDTTSRIIA
jgi:monoamine oxidase